MRAAFSSRENGHTWASSSFVAINVIRDRVLVHNSRDLTGHDCINIRFLTAVSTGRCNTLTAA